MIATEAKAAWRYARDEMEDYVKDNDDDVITTALGISEEKMKEKAAIIPQLIMTSDSFTELWCKIAKECDSLNEFVYLFDHTVEKITKIQNKLR